MRDNIAGVENNPIRPAGPSFKACLDAKVYKLLIDVVRDRENVPVGIPGTKDAIVTIIDDLAHVQNDNTFCLFVKREPCDEFSFIS